MQPSFRSTAITALFVALAWGLHPAGLAQVPAEREYLAAILPPDLIRYGGVEVPSSDNIRILSDGAGRHLEFRLIPGQAKKNNGIRAESILSLLGVIVLEGGAAEFEEPSYGGRTLSAWLEDLPLQPDPAADNRAVQAVRVSWPASKHRRNYDSSPSASEKGEWLPTWFGT